MTSRWLRGLVAAFAVGASAASSTAASSQDASPTATCAVSAWRLLFANGPDGERLEGERSDLVAAIRRGSPVRVGWGEGAEGGSWSVEEYANATFVNVMGGEQVVAQIEPAMLQTHYTDAAKARLRTPILDWQAIIATDGRFDAVVTEREGGAVVRELDQRYAAFWYAFAPDAHCDERALPDVTSPDHPNMIVRDTRAASKDEPPDDTE